VIFGCMTRAFWLRSALKMHRSGGLFFAQNIASGSNRKYVTLIVGAVALALLLFAFVASQRKSTTVSIEIDELHQMRARLAQLEQRSSQSQLEMAHQVQKSVSDGINFMVSSSAAVQKVYPAIVHLPGADFVPKDSDSTAQSLSPAAFLPPSRNTRACSQAHPHHRRRWLPWLAPRRYADAAGSLSVRPRQPLYRPLSKHPALGGKEWRAWVG
jgi:outer membrane murein-binding lipoprotein Lpp